MKKRVLLLIGCLFFSSAWALSGQEYMQRFTNWLTWNEALPQSPSPAFLAFVQEDTPLARKLRAKWLYQLARNHDWAAYNQYYALSSDRGLVCLSAIAYYETGDTEKAKAAAQTLWLSGENQPPVCNQLFNKWLITDAFDENLITQRIQLALENRNLDLAIALLKQYKKPRLLAAKLIQQIANRPTTISLLNSGELAGDFYLFGLKKLVLSNMNQAVNLWNTPKARMLLTENQKQRFLTFITLHKALRNSPDTLQWFKKIKPAWYNHALMEWQIRFALKTANWKAVERLILAFSEKDAPVWQYWLASALQAQGQTQQAQSIYENLALNRHYYGFLASFKLHKNPSFQAEEPVTNLAVLAPYQPFLKLVEKLYNNGDIQSASRLLNDFASEMPREDNSALVYWISSHLKWHGKSIYLSSNEALSNQLALRFPLAWLDVIKQNAKKYHLPAAFILAIIKQESGFREDASSPVGAKGLMQLMPATASMVARKEKMDLANLNQLLIGPKNITLGVAYLSQLYARYNKHLVLIAAAYNAGPSQLNYWLRNHPPKEMDIWIETLPWQETRNYLKNVIAFYTVYQYRLETQPNLGQVLRSL